MRNAQFRGSLSYGLARGFLLSSPQEPDDEAMDLMDNAEIERWLAELKIEHQDLDEVIHHLIQSRHHDSMRVQRLKKRKLKLKDMMTKLASQLIPDLDA
jgi:hypothetical protein